MGAIIDIGYFLNNLVYKSITGDGVLAGYVKAFSCSHCNMPGIHSLTSLIIGEKKQLNMVYPESYFYEPQNI